MSKKVGPGAYIVEGDPPLSIVAVPTAVPAFIGYTGNAQKEGKSLSLEPTKISSIKEYENFFGKGFSHRFTLAKDDSKDPHSGTLIGTADIAGTKYTITRQTPDFCLYRSMQLFFENGGGPCYIVSAGSYKGKIEKETLQAGIDTLLKEEEPTILVIPEAIKLDSPAECYALQQQMQIHCGEKMKNRVALLDVYDGFKDRKDPSGDCIKNFREGIGTFHLDYGAAYYPWLNASLYFNQETIMKMITNKEILGQNPDPGFYQPILRVINDSLNLMAPSSAMAGIYCTNDSSRGVWKAPANLNLDSVVSPSVSITSEEQEDLNRPGDGKAVNAIRAFPGEGILVWGACTLDGNGRDWRYINVRRTEIMLEQSIRLTVKALIFKPNTEATWNSIDSAITEFLRGLWHQGGLAGATPSDAFQVQVGLGKTMTKTDIQKGILRISIQVALCRPGEFINISIEQKQQPS